VYLFFLSRLNQIFIKFDEVKSSGNMLATADYGKSCDFNLEILKSSFIPHTKEGAVDEKCQFRNFTLSSP